MGSSQNLFGERIFCFGASAFDLEINIFYKELLANGFGIFSKHFLERLID